MDDKEKEKFGVIIDKQNQSESEQPKVEEKSPENKNIESEQPKVEEKSPENEIIKTENENIGVSDVKQAEDENKTENTPQNQDQSSDNDANDNLSISLLAGIFVAVPPKYKALTGDMVPPAYCGESIDKSPKSSAFPKVCISI